AAQNESMRTAQVIGEARARAAAGGTALNSPTIADIVGGIARTGAVRQEGALYEGNVRAQQDLLAGKAAAMRGRNYLTGSILEGVGRGAEGIARNYPRLQRSQSATAGSSDWNTVTTPATYG